MPTHVSVRPELLRWAMKRASLDSEGLAAAMSLTVETIEHLTSSGELSLSRLETIARKTHTPVGFFFLKEPPSSALPIADFRTISGNGSEEPSPELLDMLQICQRRQNWYRDYILRREAPVLEFVGSADPSLAPADVAESIRTTLEWGAGVRDEVSSQDAALREFASRADRAGVLVMRSGVVGNNTRRKLDVEEFRGFALSDEYAPLVFVNSADARSAQMFTLAHELCHIWIGDSGVSDVSMSSANERERFCNRVASEVLVPFHEFASSWNRSADPWEQARLLSRQFRVSRLVILIRAMNAGVLDRSTFNVLYPRALGIGGRSDSSDGGDFYKTQGVRLGASFSEAVIVSALEGGTSYKEAFRLLGVRSAETFENMARHKGVIE